MSGIVEPAELTLVSLLQSVPCVYYHATVGSDQDRRGAGDGLRRRSSRSASASAMRPGACGSSRAARGSTHRSASRARPTCPATNRPVSPSGREARPRSAEIDEAVAVAALLTVARPETAGDPARDPRPRWSAVVPRVPARAGRSGHDRRPGTPLLRPRRPGLGRHRRRRRIRSSTTRRSRPTSPRRGPTAPSSTIRPRPGATRRSPASGSGVRWSTPVIDPAANALPLADAEAAARAERTFRIAPETLILAASDEVPLLIAHGVPGVVVGRGQARFMVGLLGAILAIASAMVVALSLGGGLGS